MLGWNDTCGFGAAIQDTFHDTESIDLLCHNTGISVKLVEHFSGLTLFSNCLYVGRYYIALHVTDRRLKEFPIRLCLFSVLVFAMNSLPLQGFFG